MKKVILILFLLFAILGCEKDKEIIRDFNYNEIATIEEIKFEVGTVLISMDSGLDLPGKNNEYALFEITITNESHEKMSYDSNDWTIVNSVGQETAVLNDGLGNGNLISGGSVSGYLLFQIPVNDSDFYLYYYKDGMKNEEYSISFYFPNSINPVTRLDSVKTLIGKSASLADEMFGGDYKITSAHGIPYAMDFGNGIWVCLEEYDELYDISEFRVSAISVNDSDALINGIQLGMDVETLNLILKSPINIEVGMEGDKIAYFKDDGYHYYLSFNDNGKLSHYLIK